MTRPRLALLVVTLLLATGAAAGTIQFEQSAYSIEESTGLLTVKITRSGSMLLPASVVCKTVEGTALSEKDFTAVDRTVNFEPGESVRTVNVIARADRTDEPDQSFQLVLTNAVGASLGAPAVATVTVIDSDPTPRVSLVNVIGNSLGDVAVTEGINASADFTVWRGESEFPVSFDYDTIDGTATAGSDYTPQHGTITGTQAKISIPILTDSTIEHAETFTLRLSNPVNVEFDEPERTIGIADPAGPPALSCGEDYYDFSRVDLWIKLNRPSTEQVSVTWTVGNDARTMVILPGRTFLTMGTWGPPPLPCGAGVPTTVRYGLSNAVNAGIVRAHGEFVRPLNVPYPQIPSWAATASIAEGNSGATVVKLPLPYAPCISRPLHYDIAVEDLTARRGIDYEIETLSATHELAVTIFGDRKYEGDETFAIRLYGDIGRLLTYTIVDDDPPATADLHVTVSAPPRVIAGTPVTFHIMASNAGPDAAESVVITDTLPPGSIFLAPKASAATCSASGNVVTCAVGTLANGEFAPVDITAQLPPGVLTNTVTVSSAASDPTPASASIPVEALASLAEVPTLSVWAFLALAAVLATAAFLRLRG